MMARLANGFGGGLSWTDDICGTASAIAIVVSLKNGKERPEDTDRQLRTYRLVNAAVNEFKDALDQRYFCGNVLHSVARCLLKG